MQPIGPVIIDLLGLELTSEEKDLLQHPLVSGIILFSRNYESPDQIAELCSHIRNSVTKPLLITVDQEGGRVQRFREGFTRLPSMDYLGKLWEEDPDFASSLAESCGWLMAAELLAVGIDMSFAPVLDLNKKLNTVIGDRAFHSQPDPVIFLAKAYIQGMNRAGMAATGKHFPGHGSVSLDSHHALPVDERTITDIQQNDLIPFAHFIQHGIEAIMPAHILFPAVDNHPVGFSKRWLQDILRNQLQFSGTIFSDDLNMEGAGFAGKYHERAEAALSAGCDMVLICNNRPGAINILDNLSHEWNVDKDKFKLLQGKFSQNIKELHSSDEWQHHLQFLLKCRTYS